jgi:hypothetical protein
MAIKLRDLQVHFDGVDRVTGINQAGFWGFGIEDDEAAHVAYVKTPFGNCLIDYSSTIYDPTNGFKPVRVGSYTKLLNFWMAVNNMDCPATLCTTSYPFETLARRN